MYIDLLFLSLILLFGLLGLIYGFVKQLLSILMWVCIILFAHPIGQWLQHKSGWDWFSEAPDLVAWGLSAFMLGLVFLCITGIVHLIRKNPQQRPIDRWLGFGLGTVKGFVFVLFIGAGIHLIPEHLRERFDQLDRDSRRSTFLRMSEPMLSWNVVSILKSLGDIQGKLAEKIEQKSEIGTDTLHTNTSHAWSLDSIEDRN